MIFPPLLDIYLHKKSEPYRSGLDKIVIKLLGRGQVKLSFFYDKGKDIQRR